MLDEQLLFAEHSLDLRKNAKNPKNYFYSIIQGKGGFDIPKFFISLNGEQTDKKFELPEQKILRQKKEALERSRKELEEMEALRLEEQKIADKIAFLAFLEDKDALSEAMAKLKSRFSTSKLKASYKIYTETGKLNKLASEKVKHAFEKGQI